MSSGDTITRVRASGTTIERLEAHPCIFECLPTRTAHTPQAQLNAERAARWSFEQRVISIGSLSSADLSIQDATVSRRHARVQVEQRGYRVLDLDSKNGVWVNQVRVKDAYLADGDILQVGGVSLRFQLTKQRLKEFPLWLEDHLGELYGASSAMRELFALIDRVSCVELSVLLCGESGTGKELAARAIHQRSARRDQPFIVFDCSAAPSALIESELFGHVRGAFTGALEPRLGAFSAAEGGSLFRDEIGELPLELQPKLLRALERREVKTLGEDQHRPIDVRVISATHRDLKAEVKAGRFRADLYYRLAVVELTTPPLRERPEDIPGLVERLIRAHSPLVEREVSFKTMNLMLKYDWPGNVRELKNYVLRAIALSAPGATQLDTQFLVPSELLPDRHAVDRPVDDAPSGQLNEQVITQVSGERALSERGSVRDDAQNLQDARDARDLQDPQNPQDKTKALIEIDLTLAFKRAKRELIERFERIYWTALLESHRDNVSAAARAAGVHRKSAEYLLKKLKIKQDRHRRSSITSSDLDDSSLDDSKLDGAELNDLDLDDADLSGSDSSGSDLDL